MYKRQIIDRIPEKKISEYAEGLLDFFRINRAELLEKIDPDSNIPDDIRSEILSAAEEYIKYTVGDDGAEEPVSESAEEEQNV